MSGGFVVRWKRFAHRAAEIQSLIILAALYWIVVVPIGLIWSVRRAGIRGAPRWTERPAQANITLDDVRRQF